MRILALVFLLFLSSELHAQNIISSLDFYPCHAGDVWQYRSVFTGLITNTKRIDSVVSNPSTKEQLIYGKYADGSPLIEKIDTLGNVYSLTFQASYTKYRLYADSGNAWQVGVMYDTIPVVSTVIYVYQTYVFGVNTTVKAIRTQVKYPPPQSPFTIGTEHLAEGFGLVKTEVEPSDVYYLSGAIVDTVHYGIITSITNLTALPQAFNLLSNYPNPFNNSTIISFAISSDCHVDLAIYDVLGRRIKTAVDGWKTRGRFEVFFEANGLASGTYFAVLKTDSNVQTHRMMYLK